MLAPIIMLAAAELVPLLWRTTVSALAATLVTAMTSYTLVVMVSAIT